MLKLQRADLAFILLGAKSVQVVDYAGALALIT